MSSTVQRAATASSMRDELRLQGRLVAPLLATYLAELGLYYIDHAIVGRLGADELAAVGLSGMVFIEVVIIGSAILSIVGVMVGNAYGAGNTEEVSRSVRVGLILAAVISIPAMVLAWFLMDLLALTGQDAVVIELGEQYTRAAVLTLPAAFSFAVLRNFVTALSRPAVITVVILLALPLNFVLDWVLVFGAFGIPGLGVRGAGYATAIVNWVMLLGLVVYIHANRFAAQLPGVRAPADTGPRPAEAHLPAGPARRRYECCRKRFLQRADHHGWLVRRHRIGSQSDRHQHLRVCVGHRGCAR